LIKRVNKKKPEHNPRKAKTKHRPLEKKGGWWGSGFGGPIK